MLVCAGNPTPAANADKGTVGVIRLPLNDQMVEKFKSEPPIASIKFVGEAEPQHEWLIAGSQNPITGRTTLLRLAKSGDSLNPLSFKAGDAVQQDLGVVAFEKLAEGNCYIRPADAQSKGEGK